MEVLHRSAHSTLLIELLLRLLLLTGCAYAELPRYYPPDILPLGDLVLREDTAVGTFICALNATSSQGYDITLSVISDFFALYSPNNSVYLAIPLDFHTNRFVQFTVVATDSMQSTTRETFTVRVTSSNLNAPVFELDVYSTEVDEDQPLKSVVFDVTVNDADYGNSRLVVECITNENFPEACSIFGVKEVQASNTFWKGQLYVKSPLNYETVRDVYQVKLLAIDGTRETIKNFEIKVHHPFSPPLFSSLPPGIIRSDAPVGAYVSQVAAYDSNYLRNRSIVYDIEAGAIRKFFQVNMWSGVITLKQTIDLGDVAFLNGLVIDVPVIAREVIDLQNSIYGNGPRTTSKQMLQVTITDVTTNLPRFDSGTYAAVCPENIPNGQQIPGLFITVSTARQQSNGQLSLVFSNKSYYDIFYILPSSGFGTINATIGVSNNSFLDYDAGVRRYDIVVMAIYNSTTGTLTSSATVILRVTNVQDKPPAFEFSLYTITVPLDTRPGVVIAVIQARSFESSQVWYSLTGSGSDMLVVGNMTGQLTLAPCPTVTGNCLADAESTFNVTLRAVDSVDSRLQGSTLISIVINASTSFPPSFTSNVYFYTARVGGMTINSTTPISALPSPSQPAPVTYQLQASRYIDLFFINVTSGVLGMLRPISASDVGANGQIILYVAASSNGATAIAQVIVQIEFPLAQSIAFSQNYTASYTASTPVGTTIVQVTARTTDSKVPIIYTIESIVGEDAEQFGIDPVTGNIRLARNISFIGKRTYILKVTAAVATDVNAARAMTYVVLTGLNILNPYFNPAAVNASISEDLAVGSQFLRLNAFTVDESIALTYELVDPMTAYDMAGNLVDKTTFNPRNVISLTPSARSVALILSAALNRKVASLMLITVAVKDNTTLPPLAAGTASVAIQIKASSRYVPTFVQGEFTGVVDTSQAAGTYVTALQAFDNDSDSVFYSLYQNDAIRGGSSSSSIVNVDRLTGVVTLRQSASSYQFSQPLTLIVQASDSYESKAFALAKVMSKSSSPFRLTFLQPYYVASLNSMSLPPLMVQATSTFPETDYFPLQYDILGENRVTVNASTGLVSIATSVLSLDGLQMPFLVFYVTAFQVPRRRFLTRKTESVPVYIAIPTVKFIRQDLYLTLPTTMPINSDVAWVMARSSNASADLIYSILVNPYDRYAIDAASGRVTVARPWPANTLRNHDIVIHATDRSGAADNMTVHIAFASQNAPPYWLFPSDDGDSIIMLENQPPYTVVTNLVQARDNESRVTYGIATEEGIVTQTKEFAIDPETGQVKTRTVLLADVADKYLLNLAATDSINQTATRFMYIRILRSSGIINPVKFSQADYYYYMPPARSGICVMNPGTSTCGRVTITDVHTGASVPAAQYVLAGGSARCTFAINPNGTIMSTSPFCLRNDSYTLLVLVPGQSGSFASVHIRIEGKSYLASLPVDSRSGSKVLDVDRFGGIPVTYHLGDYVTYVSYNGTTIVNGTSLIQVDSATGSVFLIAALPPAWAAGNLQFTVLATDSLSGTLVDNSSITVWLPGEDNLLRLRIFGPAYTTLLSTARYLQEFFSASQVFVHSMTDVGAATSTSGSSNREFEIVTSVVDASAISLLMRSQIARLIKNKVVLDTVNIGGGTEITIVKDTSLQNAYIYITYSLSGAVGMPKKPAESLIGTRPAATGGGSLYYGLAAAVALLLLLLCILLPVIVACCCCCAPCCAAAAGGKSAAGAQYFDITRKLSAWQHMTSAYGAEVLDEDADYNYFENDAYNNYDEQDTNVDYYKTFVNSSGNNSSGGAATTSTAAAAAAAANGSEHIQHQEQTTITERVFQNSWNRDNGGQTSNDALRGTAGNANDSEPVDVIISGLAPGSITLVSELKQSAPSTSDLATASDRGLATAEGSHVHYATVSRKQDVGSDGMGHAGEFSHTATVRRPVNDAEKSLSKSGRSTSDVQRNEVYETFTDQRRQELQPTQQGTDHRDGSGDHRSQRTVTETSEVVEEQRRIQGSRESAFSGEHSLRIGSHGTSDRRSMHPSGTTLSTVTSVSTAHPLTVILDAQPASQGMIAEKAEYEIRPDVSSQAATSAAATLSAHALANARAAGRTAAAGSYTIELAGQASGPQLASTVDEYEIHASHAMPALATSTPYYR